MKTEKYPHAHSISIDKFPQILLIIHTESINQNEMIKLSNNQDIFLLTNEFLLWHISAAFNYKPETFMFATSASFSTQISRAEYQYNINGSQYLRSRFNSFFLPQADALEGETGYMQGQCKWEKWKKIYIISTWLRLDFRDTHLGHHILLFFLKRDKVLPRLTIVKKSFFPAIYLN